MSEDLIERLRRMAKAKAVQDYDAGRKPPAYGHESEPEWQAAAEIERLRAKLVEVKRLTDGLNDEVQFMRNVAKENRNRTEAAEKRLASAKEVIAPFSDMAKHHAADAPEWRDHHAVHAMVLVGHLRATAEWMEKGDE
ncbi:hypothetical protein JYP46_01300 [Nitratireductor aquimarinus]|uniref:hypothetical protein n=1 Tax=Alphaproteobacteria TaxID=28211 RepID=UPI0019D3496F|nr:MULTISPECIES: hypothetical protein [Alphaproteobacteria]MBN7755446.1 hypothetical protein [Nitratireductor aquimarinus]MBY5998201.1 hypothetical protein [Tritonibacter mobilis]MBY6020228.1 hypothetical protein [Nitratireductor sp. DP7N14-4]